MTFKCRRKSLFLFLSVLVISFWNILVDTRNHVVLHDKSRRAKATQILPPQESPTPTTAKIQPLNALLTGVLVEIRCHKALLIILQQSMRHFLDHEIRLVVWHSADNIIFLRNLIAAVPLLKSCWERKLLVLHEFDPHDYGFNGKFDHKRVRYQGSYWYQRLLKSATFWEAIPTSYMINLQTDGLVCRPPSPDDSFFARLQNGQTIDYLGGISGSASIFDPTTGNKTGTKFKVSQIPSPSNMTANYNLNGGFSLHSIPWTLNCIEQYESRPLIRGYSEDKLWNFCRSQEVWSVTELDAYAFASNTGATKCFQDPNGSNRKRRICPFGVHKPWKKKRLGSYKELEHNCPGLRVLEGNQDVFVDKEICDVVGMNKTLVIPCSCRGGS
jgi:hypothetical protein